MQGRERKSEREREGAPSKRCCVRPSDGPTRRSDGQSGKGAHFRTKEGGEVRKKWARSDGAAAEVFVGIAARELGVGERERGAKSGPDRWCGVSGVCRKEVR